MFANKGDVKGLKLEGLGTNHQLCTVEMTTAQQRQRQGCSRTEAPVHTTHLELAIALHFLAGSIRELEADLCLHFCQASHLEGKHPL